MTSTPDKENNNSPVVDKGPSSPAGKALYVQDGSRRVKVYTLTESDLDQLTLLDTIFNVSLAIATSLLSLATGIRLSVSLAGNSVPQPITQAWDIVFWSFISLGAVLAVICFLSFRKRKSGIGKIKSETFHEQ